MFKNKLPERYEIFIARAAHRRGLSSPDKPRLSLFLSLSLSLSLAYIV